MSKQPRIAQPGDIFILLVPTGEEADNLRRRQMNLNNQFGGQSVTPIHITVERFSPDNRQLPKKCITSLQNTLQTVNAFDLTTDALIQFHAPYWQSYVLRWRITETSAWKNFRQLLQTTLKNLNCPSHFVRRRHATCTILKLEQQIDSHIPQPETPISLFRVQELWISTLRENAQFEVVEKIQLRD